MGSPEVIPSVEFHHFIKPLQLLARWSGRAEFNEEQSQIVIVLRHPQPRVMHAAFTQAEVDCMQTHPYRFQEPTNPDACPTARNRKAVAEKVGEAFYRSQEKMIEGWEQGKPAPAGLITDEGKAVRQVTKHKSHKVKPEPRARVRDIQGNEVSIPAWLQGIK